MEEIKKLLGGYNCGGCGCEDCEECSEAIKNGKVPCDICPMIEENNIKKIKEILAKLKK
ncbi:MAG: hypothetical protein KBT30_02645 [Clostridiales bacterium]|nr:hypothetical protein [Candidatus Apopatousia equi]